MANNRLILDHDISLENGNLLKNVEISYHTYGTFIPRKSKVVWVCHALTANSDVYQWWAGLFGSSQLYNHQDYFIVCANVLGSHYGTTGPLSKNPQTDLPYFHEFPEFSIRDMIKLHHALARHLKIDQIHTLIGGSLGGQQALEWAVMEPKRFKNLILLATNAKHSSWGIAFNASQRWAIENDITWTEKSPKAGIEGLKIARSIALLSYRNEIVYNSSQKNIADAISYQKYQGEKLSKRFNAYSYWYLSHAMDGHDVAKNRQSSNLVLQSIQSRTLIISMQNDLLFPLSDQKFLHEHIPESEHQLIQTNYGHDGFLVETKKISACIQAFYHQSSAFTA